MASDTSDSSDTNVTHIEQARKERLDKSPIPYGRRQSDDPGGPNLSARIDDLKTRPNVRPVRQAASGGGRRFDREKVEKIKAQLARGEYKIDSLKVADMFIEHERHN
jgi:flagellar biosynthesis anti-sigma factor FlgM